MSDHVWLINTSALFTGSRYILRVAPTHKKPTESDLLAEAVDEMGEFVCAQLASASTRMTDRINYVEQNNRFMLEHHYQGLDFTITKLHLL